MESSQNGGGHCTLHDYTVRVRDDVNSLARMLDVIHARTYHSYWDCFRKLVEVSLEATRRLTMLDMQWEPELAGYERAREQFYQAYGVLVSHVYPEPTYQDVIGSLYMAISGRDRARFGQYFTPWNVAKTMAEIALEGVDLSAHTPDHPLTVMDPACGSGVMLLAVASALPREFIDQGRLRLVGVDIDWLCVSMARLNLMLYGLSGRLEHGSALAACGGLHLMSRGHETLGVGAAAASAPLETDALPNSSRSIEALKRRS
jgi:hypothetical protein